MNNKVIDKVNAILEAYRKGELGDTTMPEDTYPEFPDLEARRIYYTLPMALNYQRNSYKLWEAAKKTYEDNFSSSIFNLAEVAELENDLLRQKLTKHKLALQPNKHIDTWFRISRTIQEQWGSVSNFMELSDSDYLKVKEIVQNKFKKGFPYLSGPKIFNYWMFIMSEYGEVDLKNREYIEIAPDTHVIQASIRLGVISLEESKYLTRDAISSVWRELLKGTGIDPIDVHSPLWFWSRSKFEYKLS